MAKQFAVLHVQKGSSNSSRLGAHIDRTFIPANADRNKSELNEHLIKSNNKLKIDIENRIAAAGCKVRSNSVKSINIILSGSHERMKLIESEKKLYEKWKNDNKKFIIDKYGKENIMRFSVHRDERTPHIHCVITPITKDGRLSAREIVGNKKDLTKLQDNYATAMDYYGLNRGVKGSKAKHYEVSEYYKRIKDPISAEISIPRKKLTENRDKYLIRIKNALKPLYFEKKKFESKNLKLKEKIDAYLNAENKLYYDNKKFLGEKEKFENKKQIFEKTINQFAKNIENKERKTAKENEKKIIETAKEMINNVEKNTYSKTYTRAISVVNASLEENNINFKFKLNLDKKKLEFYKPNTEKKQSKHKGLGR